MDQSKPEESTWQGTSGRARDPGGVFATTHWSVVYTASELPSEASAEALETLCRTYWYPLYAYVRRLGRSPEDSEDLIQAFFAKILEKDYLRAAAREKGRFRTFLLTALKRFMANEWDREHALKRGGFVAKISIDQEVAEERFRFEPAHSEQPDILFDRNWAMALLDQTMARLQEEYVASGRALLFEQLQKCLVQDEDALPYLEIAQRLQSTEAGVKMAMHRLRSRYRELLRENIAQTVTSSDELHEEMCHLFGSFQ